MPRWQVIAVDYGVVMHNAALCNPAVKEHTVKANEYIIAHRARAMDYRSVCNGCLLADGHRRTGFRVNDDTILDVRMRPDDDWLHIAFPIDFVGTDYGIGSDKYVLIHDDTTAKDGSLWSTNALSWTTGRSPRGFLRIILIASLTLYRICFDGLGTLVTTT